MLELLIVFFLTYFLSLHNQAFGQHHSLKSMEESVKANYTNNALNTFKVKAKFVSAIAMDTTYYEYSFFADYSKKPDLLIHAQSGLEHYIFYGKDYLYYDDSLQVYKKDKRKNLERLGYYMDIMRLPYWDLGKIFNANATLQSHEADHYTITSGDTRYLIAKKSLAISKIIKSKKTKWGTEYWEYGFESSHSSNDLDSIISDVSTRYSQKEEQIYVAKKMGQNDLGSTYPAFTAKSVDDVIYESKNLRGKYVALDFFYQSCLPCIKAIPEWIQLRNEIDTSQLLKLGIDPLPKDSVQMKKFMERYKINYDVIVGYTASKLKETVGHTGYPFTVLINPEGKIDYIVDGYTPAEFRVFKKYLINKLQKP